MAETIPERLLAHARAQPGAPAYHVWHQGAWRPTSWSTFADEVRQVARALIALGVERGERVGILGFNRPEWAIFDHAAMMIGAVPAGIYTTCSSEEVHYIVHHSEARVVLVENPLQLAKLLERRSELPRLEAVVSMRGAQPSDEVLTWEQLVARAAEVKEEQLDQRLAMLAQEDLATLIYTSGTTGPPKAVMLSHHNLAWMASQLQDSSELSTSDCLLSYLPLSHIAEQMATLHAHATAGYAVYYAESLERVADNLKSVRPTIFFGVPRIWEKMAAAIEQRLAQARGARRLLVQRARKVCLEVHRRRGLGLPVGPYLALRHRLYSRLVTSKIKVALGFDRARRCSSGAAPIGREVLELFASLDLPIYEVYGQSEGSGPTSYNQPGRCKLGTVGQPMRGLEVKLADDGEILVRGPSVFLGYLKDPSATAATLHDGWLCSGDLGAFDADGYLSITGRKKDLIITSGGKNIAPRNLEDGLEESGLIADAVVIGDRRKFLSALLVLDEEQANALRQRARAAGEDEQRAVTRAVQAVVDEVNSHTAQVARIKRFTVLAAPFSIEGGELTPTLKLKRAVVADKYRAQIDAMYTDEATD